MVYSRARLVANQFWLYQWSIYNVNYQYDHWYSQNYGGPSRQYIIYQYVCSFRISQTKMAEHIAKVLLFPGISGEHAQISKSPHPALLVVTPSAAWHTFPHGFVSSKKNAANNSSCFGKWHTQMSHHFPKPTNCCLLGEVVATTCHQRYWCRKWICFFHFWSQYVKFSEKCEVRPTKLMHASHQRR